MTILFKHCSDFLSFNKQISCFDESAIFSVRSNKLSFHSLQGNADHVQIEIMQKTIKCTFFL